MTGTTSQGGKPPGDPPQTTARNSQGLLLCSARWSRAIAFETQGGTRNRTRDLPKKGSAFITCTCLVTVTHHLGQHQVSQLNYCSEAHIRVSLVAHRCQQAVMVTEAATPRPPQAKAMRLLRD